MAARARRAAARRRLHGPAATDRPRHDARLHRVHPQRRAPGVRRVRRRDRDGLRRPRRPLHRQRAPLQPRARDRARRCSAACCPTGLTAPSSVEIRHRYLPGNQLIEVGGDWYDVIPLPGGRVALVVGDVVGHGMRAAVTMGRLRTALQTIVNLELSPADGLQQLDDLMREHRRARARLRDLRVRRVRRDRRHLRDRLRRAPAAAAAPGPAAPASSSTSRPRRRSASARA